MTAKKGLGRGFGSLLPTGENLNESFDPTAGMEERVSELRQIELTSITPDPSQPRREFDKKALSELASSIKEHGVIQPLIVIPHKGAYMLVAGERRWRASQQAGLKKVPALVRTLSNQHKLELALIENVQRENLNPIEIAVAFKKLRDDFSMTLDEISRRVGGKSAAAISNYIRILGLPSDAKKALSEQKISEGHARQILSLNGQPKVQKMLLENIIKENWSVRRAEQFVIGYKKGSGEKKIAAKNAIETETSLTKKLSKQLKTKVKVKTMAHANQLIVEVKSDKDLEEILKRF